jgi:hypothetical protein
LTSPEPRSAGRTIAIGAAVLAAVVVAILVRGRGAPEEDKPVGPKVALIEITSVPTDSTVTRADGGPPLGRTPLMQSFPQSTEDLIVVVHHDGYQDRRVDVPLFSANGRIDVTLTKVGEDAGPSP